MARDLASGGEGPGDPAVGLAVGLEPRKSLRWTLLPTPRLVLTFRFVDVVLRKVGRKPGRAVVGRLLRPPRKGSVLVIEFPDGLHEYVTTPVKRVLRVCGREIYYVQTANSCYRLEVRSGENAALEARA